MALIDTMQKTGKFEVIMPPTYARQVFPVRRGDSATPARRSDLLVRGVDLRLDERGATH